MVCRVAEESIHVALSSSMSPLTQRVETFRCDESNDSICSTASSGNLLGRSFFPRSVMTQKSMDHPSCSGVTSPCGSMIGYTAKSGNPTAVQFLWVRLIWLKENARGTKEASFGLNWRSTQ